MKRLALLFAALGLAVFGASASATAADNEIAYPAGSTLTLTAVPAIGGPNYPFVATLSACYPGETVNFSVNGGPIVPSTCDSVTFQASANLTAPAAIGVYPVTATAVGPTALVQGIRATALPAQTQFPRPQTLSANIEVVDQSPPAPTTTVVPTGQIPTTGSSGISSSLTIAGVLLAVGVGLLIVTQIRRRNASSTS